MAESVAEEPLLISQLVRFATWGILLPRLERALSLTAFTERQLASMQQMVESAERPRALVRALAGEQACCLTILADRKQMAMTFRGFQSSSSRADDLRVAAFINLLRITGLLQRDKAFFCAGSAGSLPPRIALPRPIGRQPASGDHHEYAESLLYLLPDVVAGPAKTAPPRRRSRGTGARGGDGPGHRALSPRSCQRLAENLEQLTPTYCKTVPNDPCDGKPLRYKTQGASYVVYSIGSDSQDNGGVTWDSNYVKVPHDVSLVVKH